MEKFSTDTIPKQTSKYWIWLVQLLRLNILGTCQSANLIEQTSIKKTQKNEI